MLNLKEPNDPMNDPHADQPVLRAGPASEQAHATLILIHGRGASAEGMLSVFTELNVDNVAALAPQAANHTWYPYSFLSPLHLNQPFLDSALRRIESLVTDLLSRGIASDGIALLGFSQGACLCAEFVARHPRRYGPVMALAGGLIGPPGMPRQYEGSLAGTSVLVACGDPDPHIPFPRVRESADVLQSMGAAIDLRRYPGLPHTINEDQINACRVLLSAVSQARQ